MTVDSTDPAGEPKAVWLVLGQKVVSKIQVPETYGILGDLGRVIRDYLLDREKPRSCWRCGAKGPHHDASGVLNVSAADDSYSGTFKVVLCFSCAMRARDECRAV